MGNKDLTESTPCSVTSESRAITEQETSDETELENLVAPQAAPRKYEIVYLNLLTFGLAHIAALYGLYLAFTVAKWKSLIFYFILFILSTFGTTAGAHRLWSHKAFKAKLPLQIILMILNSLAFQNTVIDWVRDHRLHHKYSDTDADPHNASRGFFFSHVGWLLVRKHPEVKKRGKTIDMSDIYANPVLTFQKKYAIPVIGTMCFLLPTLIPVYFFEESLSTAWFLTMTRYVLNLNAIYSVNSAAHMWGTRPYDKNIKPVQNILVSLVVLGEGSHNYHHVFPWDYRAAELGSFFFNLSATFIDFFALFGWAYDLRSVPKDIVASRIKRTGGETKI